MITSLGEQRAAGYVIFNEKEQRYVVTFDEASAKTFSIQQAIRRYIFLGTRYSDV